MKTITFGIMKTVLMYFSAFTASFFAGLVFDYFSGETLRYGQGFFVSIVILIVFHIALKSKKRTKTNTLNGWSGK